MSSAGPETSPSRRTTWAALSLIVLGGLILRLWGITSGLPYAYNVAERGWIVAAYSFHWGEPMSVLFTSHSVLLILEAKLLWLLRPLLGWLPWPPYIELTGDPSGTLYLLLGRWTSALLGAASAVPVYLLGRWAWGRREGLVAAAFAALSFAPVRESHFGAPDIPGIFLVLLGIWLCTRLADTGRWPFYLGAGVLAGLALSAKLLNWPAFLVLLLFHAFASPAGAPAPGSGRWAWVRAKLLHPKLLAAAGAGVAAFLGCTPQLVIAPEGYLGHYRTVAALGRLGGVDRYAIAHDPAWLFYLKALRWGVGDLLTLLTLAGLVWVFVRRSRRAMLVMAYPVALYALLLSPGRVYLARYAQPAVPFLLLAAAGLLIFLVDFLVDKAGLRRPWVAPVTAVLVVAVLAQPVYKSVLHGRILSRTDTRTLAKAWIDENIPPGSRIMTEWHSAPLSRSTYQVEVTGPYGLRDRSQRSGEEPQPRSVEELRSQGLEYLIHSSFTSDHPMIDPREEEEKRAFYRQLDREAELVAEFQPYREGKKPPFDFDQVYGPTIRLSWLERPGPTLKIYRLAP